MNQKKSLPLYGIGPLYVYTVVALDVIAIILSHYQLIPKVELSALRVPCIILGVVLVVVNIGVWIKAAILSKLDENIKQNQLVVTGIYAWMRNPIYSAVTFALLGIKLLYGNLLLLPLLVVDWILLTVLLKHTEEKWLYERFGAKYLDYCEKVNRFIPWFPRKK